MSGRKKLGTDLTFNIICTKWLPSRLELITFELRGQAFATLTSSYHYEVWFINKKNKKGQKRKNTNQCPLLVFTMPKSCLSKKFTPANNSLHLTQYEVAWEKWKTFLEFRLPFKLEKIQGQNFSLLGDTAVLSFKNYL